MQQQQERTVLTKLRRSIELALLNDNDMSRGKMDPHHINSAEGEHEFTMDEVEVIQNYLLTPRLAKTRMSSLSWH
jgi:cell division protein FtsZ